MRVIYDIETFPNIFTIAIKPVGAPGGVFELSDFRDDREALFRYLKHVTSMVGFNNLGFDYPVLHLLLTRPMCPYTELYVKAMQIINDHDDRFSHIIWQPEIPQIDLYKIHHFDNPTKRTGLKILEFNMCSENIQDLPFAPGTILNSEQVQVLKQYNYHDVTETERFYNHSLDMIKFREQLGPEQLNYNDTKIGKQYFIKEIEKVAPGTCFNSDRTPRQSPRYSGVKLSEIIFPYIKFQFSNEMNDTLNWLKQRTVMNTRGELKTVFTYRDNEITIGSGGIHGSVNTEIVRSSDTHMILDLDVTSFYPSIAIENNVYPEHLGMLFVDIYRKLKAERVLHPKKSVKNAALKLALNGVYGDSNNEHSPFYDPKYMLTITINGQLLLLMLLEQLLNRVPGLRMIQINTDGITVQFPRKHKLLLDAVCSWFQSYTRMQLESVEYANMFIRDVNNYIAQPVAGDTKRKGAYEYKLEWHKNFSFLVIQKMAENYFMKGVKLWDSVLTHPDPWDFLGRVKISRTHRLVTDQGEQLQNVSRYYVSNSGVELIKIMPPLSGKTDPRRNRINAGQRVTICNKFDGKLSDVNYGFYVLEAQKLLF